MYILGIHDGHGSGAVFLKDGRIIRQSREEILSKNESFVGYPKKSLEELLSRNILNRNTLDVIAIPKVWGAPFFSDERSNQDSVVRAFLFFVPFIMQAKNIALYLQYKWYRLSIVYWFMYSFVFKWIGARAVRKEKNYLQELFGITPDMIKHYEHHAAHAAVAYYRSPFRSTQTLVFTVDGEGDLVSATVNIALGNTMKCIAKTPASASLGYIFMETTAFLGYSRMRDEYLVMKLATENEKKIKRSVEFQAMLKLMDPLLYRSRQEPLRFSSLFDVRAFGYFLKNNFSEVPPEMVAVIVQTFLENKLVTWVRDAIGKTGIRRICFGGGVAANSKAMHLISTSPNIEGFFVPANPGDESLAEGAAILAFTAAT